MRVPSTVEEFVGWPSPSESARFGLMVRRYVLIGRQAETMLDAIRRDAADLSVVRIPTDRLDVIARLHREFDAALLADCLVIYHRDNLQCGPPNPPTVDGLEFVEANEDDAERLDSVVEESFRGYPNHYSANPMISPDDVLSGYREWAGSFIQAPNRKAILACAERNDAGFVTLEWFSDEGQVVLNGVRPSFRGRGVYRAIVRMAVQEFVKAGLPRSVISTQIDNRTVQRVWVSEGFRFTKSYYTMHVSRA